MSRIFLSCFLLMQFLNLLSQNYQISGTLPGLVNQNVYLMRILAENRKIIDTAQTDQTGLFVFELKNDSPIGLYAIISGPNQLIELLFNNENIRIVTTGNSPEDQVQIVESIENLIYYDYLYAKGMTLYKTDLLQPLIQKYPEDDPFYKAAVMQYNLLKNNFEDRVNTLIRENPETFAAHLIKADQPMFADPELSQKLQTLYLKNHYFDNTDFNDTLLTRSNILSSKVVGYLSLYQEDNMTKEALESSLLVGLDTVLTKAATNQHTYEYVVDFLINGFQAIGFETGLEYLAAKSRLDQFCVNTERKKELENKIELINKLAVGKPAPNFETIDLKGNMIRLSDIIAEKTVLVFWASWCPHCDEILPFLKEYYDPKNSRQLEIIAVSIDESREDVENTISKNGYNWINIAELQGWNGAIVQEYGISATPSIFVLDNDKNIIGKPSSLDELKKMMTNP